ncbi:MAG: DUF4032 domain-containing protein [Candidatus Woesearchaeota archaeon]
MRCPVDSRSYNLSHYLVLQCAELKEHKWYLSQRAGHDVGPDAALWDWIQSGHAGRFQRAYFRHPRRIEIVMSAVETGRVELTQERVHRLLRDETLEDGDLRN